MRGPDPGQRLAATASGGPVRGTGDRRWWVSAATFALTGASLVILLVLAVWTHTTS